MSSTTDTEDWLGTRRGDYRSYERLYHAHAPALIRYGRQYAGPELVEEAVQELFVRIWERRATLNVDAKPRPYLLVSLRNDLIRLSKKARRQLQLDDQHEGEVASQESELVRQDTAAEQAAGLEQAMARLSVRERELVDLRFRQNLEYEDIVEVTGISYQSARNTLARAIGKLREHLAQLIIVALGTKLCQLTYLLGSPYLLAS